MLNCGIIELHYMFKVIWTADYDHAVFATKQETWLNQKMF